MTGTKDCFPKSAGTIEINLSLSTSKKFFTPSEIGTKNFLLSLSINIKKHHTVMDIEKKVKACRTRYRNCLRQFRYRVRQAFTFFDIHNSKGFLYLKSNFVQGCHTRYQRLIEIKVNVYFWLLRSFQ